MKLDKHVVDMFTELTKPADDVKMEKTCYGTISVVDGTRYVKLDGSDLLVPAASTVKTSHGDRVTVLMKNHSLTVTGNLTAPATDGEGGSSGEAGTAATIEVGTVTTGEAGSSATVTNVGTTSAAVFDFVIPKGDKGEKGDHGPQGPQGEKGDTGTWDGTIPDHEHTVSDITDFPTSLPANGGNADTLDGKHANDFMQWFGILDDTSFVNDANYKVDYHCNISDGTLIGLPMANWYHIVYYMHSYSNGHGMQIAYPLSFDGATFIRRSDGTTWTNWKNVADGGNANTLESHPASDFYLKTDIVDASRELISPNSRAKLWEDSEGGNLRLTSPDGHHYVEMDLYDNNSFRMYFVNEDSRIIHPLGYDFTTEKLNINGDADTVDGKHASSFLGSNTNFNYHYANGAGTQVVSIFRVETHIFAFNYTDTPTAYGFLDVSSFDGAGFSPAPFGLVRQVWTDWANPAERFVRIYRATSETDGTWTDWSRCNAVSVGAYTEAKLAELEARIAALEGGTK